jgi:Tfp pilus assembly protein FimT
MPAKGLSAGSQSHPTPQSHPTSTDRRAFTLLELLLGIALTALVLVIVSTAISIHYRIIATGQSHIEEAQLARALLRRIADDLRSTVEFNPQKIDQLQLPSTTSSDALASATGVLDGSTDSLLDGQASDDADDGEATTESSNIASNASPKQIPGIYGNRDAIQIDVGRLPRMDQLAGQISPESGVLPNDRISDVKSVAYYTIGSSQSEADAADQHGLIRRELDRAVAQFAADQGQLDSMVQDLAPIAPEVAGIEFEYYRGDQACDSWDTAENGCLPTAVRVTIYIVPKKVRDSALSGSSGLKMLGVADASSEDSTLAYSLLVAIPSAEAAAQSGSSEEDADSTDGNDSSSKSSNSSNNASSDTSGDDGSEPFGKRNMDGKMGPPPGDRGMNSDKNRSTDRRFSDTASKWKGQDSKFGGKLPRGESTGKSIPKGDPRMTPTGGMRKGGSGASPGTRGRSR